VHIAATALAALCVGAHAAAALTIELKDVAADRVERQRAAAAGALPLPGTPNIAAFQERLANKGLALAAPIMIRVFKSESELEIWKQKGDKFVLFATYPICHWSGTIGPKLRDGDKQAPEGYYTISRAQTRHVGRWPKAIDVGYPNILERSQARTGSAILIHGGCTSVGCFAMTNPVMDEIHLLASASIEAGQPIVPMHVYPFRMTDQNMRAHALSPWRNFWANLKEGYDSFERTKRPPTVDICNGRYIYRDSQPSSRVGTLEACAPTLMAIRDQDQWLENVPRPSRSWVPPPPTVPVSKQAQTTIDNDQLPTPTFSWPLVR
jgi:murein L,D-transpeptidase YafK